eukprot:GAHX01003592.1.p1 GENE.GAHX01003592.1~~GAHX01003592.1.p1  ORF type:complete len:238 (+),score=48.58 GAHX01003592.1:44-757(+)
MEKHKSKAEDARDDNSSYISESNCPKNSVQFPEDKVPNYKIKTHIPFPPTTGHTITSNNPQDESYDTHSTPPESHRLPSLDDVETDPLTSVDGKEALDNKPLYNETTDPYIAQHSLTESNQTCSQLKKQGIFEFFNIGQAFSSYSEFEAVLKQFNEKYKTKLFMKRNKRIESLFTTNKKLRNIKNFISCLTYYEVEFICEFGEKILENTNKPKQYKGTDNKPNNNEFLNKIKIKNKR